MNFDICNKFPAPLPQNEIYSYFEKMKEGDPEAKETIIKHNMRLVVYEARKFRNTPYEEEELISVGYIGLVKSVNTFDISKNYKFSTYAIRCIDNEIKMFIRREKKHIGNRSLAEPLVTNSEGKELTLEDVFEDITSDFVSTSEDKIIYNEVRNVVLDLPERDREIILLYFGFYYGKSYTTGEIAQMLGISQSYVSRLIVKNLKKIEKKLEKKGIIEFEKQSDRKEKTNMARQLQSIYEYLDKYSKEQIDEVISNLTDEEKKLIKLRYGDDLENPVTSELWTPEASNNFYCTLVPRMKKLLANLEEKKLKGEKSSSRKVKKSDNTELEKAGYIKVLQLMRTPTTADMLKVLTPKEAVIIFLKLGYIDKKYFSTESIAKFLEIESEEIREITKKVLMVYKEKISQFIDKAIDVANGQHLVEKQPVSNDTNQSAKKEKENYIKTLQLMKTSNFKDTLEELSPKEAVIIILKLGYIDEKYFSTESIAKFLGVEPEEVREITKKVLMSYKENINQLIDNVIDATNGQYRALEKNKPNI